MLILRNVTETNVTRTGITNVQRLCNVKVPVHVLLMITKQYIMVMHNVFLKLIKNFQIIINTCAKLIKDFKIYIKLKFLYEVV